MQVAAMLEKQERAENGDIDEEEEEEASAPAGAAGAGDGAAGAKPEVHVVWPVPRVYGVAKVLYFCIVARNLAVGGVMRFLLANACWLHVVRDVPQCLVCCCGCKGIN